MASKLNDWDYAKLLANNVELLVRLAINSIGFDYVRNNAEIRQAVDLAQANRRIEVKCAFTPYPRDPTPAGLAQAEHITLDHTNIVKYDDEVVLFIVVANYPERNGLFSITAGRCKAILAAHPERVYLRSKRTFKDKVKKVGFAISECLDLSHIVERNIMQELLVVAQAAK
jgi:hypothetical protein